MKIAATYENGNIFQHFGCTEFFKIYEIEDGKIVSGKVINANGIGHGELANLLSGEGVDVLICGGIGGGAQTALSDAGVELCSGAEGDADAAVEAYLKGELLSAGATCNHHDGEHSCADHEAGHCGHHDENGKSETDSCASQGGCCHQAGKDSFDEIETGENGVRGVNVGKTCVVHYKGTFNDGTQFDSSYDRGEPLEFLCGAGMMIPGFDAAVAKMSVGEIIDVHLMPEEAYGPKDPKAFVTAKISDLPGAEELEVGEKVYLRTPDGQPIPVTVAAKDEETVTFDANHEMAGRELNFRIELVELK